MKTLFKNMKLPASAILVTALLTTAGCMTPGVNSESTSFALSGSQENPSVMTPAVGYGTLVVWPNREVAGSFLTFDMGTTAAHIHEGAPGVNGPVIVPLVRTADGRWTVPAGTRLTDAQYESYKAGNLYVNAHSAAYPNGQLRGQVRTK